jgi:hypothetical protein
VVTWKEMPRSPGHVFYDRLQGVLIAAGFDAFAETTCKPYYAAEDGCAVDSARPVLPERSSFSSSMKPASASSSASSLPSQHDHNSHIVNGPLRGLVLGSADPIR